MISITSYMKTAYGMDSPYSAKAVAKQTKVQEEQSKKLREQLRALSKDGRENTTLTGQNQMTGAGNNTNSILNSSWLYGESIRSGRQKTKETAATLNKVKYQFKDISSKIIRSKTSASARQVASQAKREVLRLKRQRATYGNEDPDLEAAIVHAKAMERVAKKKVRHLEEEEMAKASQNSFVEEMEEKEETDLKNPEEEEGADEENGTLDQEDYESLTYDSAELSKGIEAERHSASSDRAAAISQDFLAAAERITDMGELPSDFSEELASMSGELTEELMEDMEEGLRDLLEEMGLDELSESLGAVKGDMDPEDLKMMKIKHRNKEMKDIVKADAEYLKTVFKNMEKSGAMAMTTGAVSSIDISV